jgi:hypothetical protein
MLSPAIHRKIKSAVRRCLMQACQPRYLLPAKLSLYSDKNITDGTPLYKDFLSLIQQATPVTDTLFNSRLRIMGAKVDKVLPR